MRRTIKSTVDPIKVDPKEVRSAISYVHILPEKGSTWRVSDAGSRPTTRKFATRETAISFAREIAQNYRKSIVILNRAGKIVEKVEVK